MTLPDLTKRMRDPLTRQTIILEFADYFRDLVLFFGGELATAANINRAITVGLERDLAELDAKRSETALANTETAS